MIKGITDLRIIKTKPGVFTLAVNINGDRLLKSPRQWEKYLQKQAEVYLKEVLGYPIITYKQYGKLVNRTGSGFGDL